jgi:hypothetical protein
MLRFPYSVWFLDRGAAEDDQDREWVACINIEAMSSEDAKQWGGMLATSYVSRHQHLRMRSSRVDAPCATEGQTAAATIQLGRAATDEDIGW